MTAESTPTSAGMRTGMALLLAYVLLVLSIVAAGCYHYRHFAQNYRAEVERQLLSIANLKVSELTQWRMERLADGLIFFRNPTFAAAVRSFLEHPGDAAAQRQLQDWLGKVQASYKYDQVRLLDTQGRVLLTIPADERPLSATVAQRLPELLQAGQVAFQDFYHDEHDQRVYLAVLVPILDTANPRRPLGLLKLRINPQHYLYPFLSRWPTPSATAETLLVRREGPEAVFLNELRFQTNTALQLRATLTNAVLPAARAALGVEGVMEGVDYRGVPVVAALRTVPASPWHLVARMDLEELYAPLHARLWQLVALSGSLSLGIGGGVALVWRRQRRRFYRGKAAAEEKLRASEARYALTLAAVNDGLWDWNLATGEAWFSPTFYTLLGYADREFTAGHAAWRSLVHPDDLARVEVELQLSVAESTSFVLDHRLKMKSGDWLWGSFHGKVVEQDAEGQTLRMVGTLSDITARKQAEAALQASSDRLTLATRAAGLGIWEYDVANNRLTWDDQMYRLYGITAVEFSGAYEAWQQGVHPEDRQRGDEEIQQALRGEKDFETEFRVLWPDGSTHYLSAHSIVERDAAGKARRMVGTNQDITARKQAEQSLQLQGAALAAAANAIIITDIRGTIEWANPAYSTLTGYTLEEVRGKNPRDLVKSGLQSAAFYRELWTTILAGRVWHGELVNCRKDGTQYTEETTITPVRTGAGGISHLISIKQDITEQKELELQLLRSQRLESVGRLAGGIAHDLNNILAPVLLAAPLLRAANPTPDAQELLDIVEKAARRGADIIRQLLTFSRGLKGERFPLQAGLLVREMFTLMRETFPKNITVHSQLPAAIPLVLGDATQLHQVLLNLCVNARDAMPAGGVLTVSVEPVTLDAAAAAAIPDARPGRYVVLGVADTGTGIAPEILDKIYDPFFTTKPVGQGTGLGLATTQGIVRSHAGFIQVWSAPGQGTRFRVFLPVSIQPLLVDSTAAAELPAAPQGHGAQVLVVDDEVQLRLMVRKILEDNGYRVLEAEDGAEALRLLQGLHEPPQAVLTDLLMPRMDGPTLIRTLRPIPVPLKIIAMSGLPLSPETFQELGLTEQTFISKPFDAPTLLNALHAVLAGK